MLVVARFCEPKSALHIAAHFYHDTALADLLGILAEEIYVNRLYRALDHLLTHKDQLQKYLKERLGEFFALRYEIIFDDITSTYFEGQADTIRERNTVIRTTIGRTANKFCSRSSSHAKVAAGL